MSLYFKRGTKLLFQDGTNTFEVLVSDFSVSDTFLEQGYATDTLHNNIAINEKIVINQKSNANFSFSFSFSDSTQVERAILRWYGLSDGGDRDYFPVSKASLNEKRDVYIVTGGNLIIHIDNAILENISFSLNPREALSAQVTGSGVTTMLSSTSVPTLGTTYTQGNFTNEALVAEIAGNNIDRLTGVTLEFTKQIQWLDGNSVHEAANQAHYIKEYAYSSGLSVSGSITKLKTNNDEPTSSTSSTIKILAGTFLEVYINNSSVTERVSIGGVLVQQSDFKAQDSYGSYIKF